MLFGGLVGTKPEDAYGIDWSYWVYYDPTSPTKLRWRVDKLDSKGRTTKARAGEVAGSVGNQTARARVSLDNKHYLTSRVVWELHNGPIPDGLVIDHIDGCPANDDIANLRIATQEMNSRNKGMYSDNKSGANGVAYHTTRMGWQASWIELDGSRKAKWFGDSRYGKEGAFALACAYRERKIKELNENGAGYTNEHGVRPSNP